MSKFLFIKGFKASVGGSRAANSERAENTAVATYAGSLALHTVERPGRALSFSSHSFIFEFKGHITVFCP